MILDDGVAAAWEAYARATGHDMLVDGAIEELLHGCYGNLGTHAIKVAMLLAAMDTAALPVRVEPRHFCRAVEIVESWRASLHRIWTTGMVTEETRTGERILHALASAGSHGLTIRSLCQRLHLRSREVKELLAVLALAGQASSITFKAANGKRIEIWTATP